MDFEENQNNDVFVVNGVANYSFVKNNVSNVKTLSSLLGLIYKSGWYYKQWKEIKKCNENYKNISPFWRGIFYIGYAKQLKDIVKGLYEAKMNMILQNEAVPQEEKEEWQKEYKKFNSIFANFSLTQQAINKILPVGHPDNKTTWGSFLGLLPFAVILMLIFGVNIISFILSGGCYQVNGNIYRNTCGNYSFTFPLNTKIGLWESNGFDNICQENEQSTICLTDLVLNNPEDFNLNTLTENETNLTDKFTKQYTGNTTHCFKVSDPSGEFINTCYMKVEKQEPLYFGFFIQNKTGDMEELESLMNSYKEIKD